VIYPPPQHERRPRGRMNPGREVAAVVVGVALVLAFLFPVAFPGVPVPQLPAGTPVAVAPPTPVSMPQPYSAGTPGTAAPGSGAPLAVGTPAVTSPALATPSLGFPFEPGVATNDPFAPVDATALDRFPGGLPTRVPRATREATAYVPGAYPGPYATATAWSPASPTPVGSPSTPTVTATPGTGTPSATAGTATATSTATTAGYPP
jgi:hypothetical protein